MLPDNVKDLRKGEKLSDSILTGAKLKAGGIGEMPKFLSTRRGPRILSKKE